MEEYAPLFGLLGALALVGNASATWVSVTTSRRLLGVERRYRSRLYALQLLERWDSTTHQPRARLRKRFVGCLREGKPIPWEDFQDALEKGIAVDEDADTILTFLDHVGLCVESEVVDEDLAESFFLTGPVAVWWEVLAGFRAREAEERGRDPWPHARRLLVSHGTQSWGEVPSAPPAPPTS